MSLIDFWEEYRTELLLGFAVVIILLGVVSCITSGDDDPDNNFNNLDKCSNIIGLKEWDTGKLVCSIDTSGRASCIEALKPYVNYSLMVRC